MAASLSDQVKLPCGLVLPNRLTKAAMAEALCKTKTHEPNPHLLEAYKKWSAGSWGAILTGNVQVDINHLGQPDDPSIAHEYRDKDTDAALLAPWKTYAEIAQQHGTPAIVQLCHPGRQSMRGAGQRGIFGAAIAPSSIRLSLGDGFVERIFAKVAFTQPREMEKKDIDGVTARFVDAARVMVDAGFSGIQIHGAHGYLVDQFLNPKTNLRTDEYGGTPEKRAKFVLDIIKAIRAVVPPTFCVGIKLNSADHQSANFEDVMTQISMIVEAGVDFMEISGGSYENPKMMTSSTAKPTTKAREAFFLQFATEVRNRYPNLVLMVTGGFRTRQGMQAALGENACDIIGIGRPATVAPDLPHRLLDKDVPDEQAGFPLKPVTLPWFLRLLPIKLLGAGAETLYFTKQIARLAKGLVPIAP